MTEARKQVAVVQPLKPPGEPPRSRGEARAVLAAQYLAGDGIEIGALHSALALPKRARVRYVDRFPVSELRRQYPSLADLDLVEVDVVGDGETLSIFADGSLDFIVASRFLECCEDPIGTIERHLDKLAPGGVLFYVVPDKVEESARFTLMESPRSEEDIREIREFEAKGESICRHVWTPAEFLGLLLRCRSRVDDGFEIEVMQRHLIEVIVVLRKARSPGGLATAPLLNVEMLDPAAEVSANGPLDESRALRTEVQRLELELNQVQSELASVIDREAEGVAENRRLHIRLADTLRSPSWRLTRPLRLSARARRWASPEPPREPEPRLTSLPIAALRPDLVDGWPEHARWRPDARIPGMAVTALEQPTDTTVRYRFALPAGARVRTRATIYARVWREAGAGAVAILRLCDENGHTLTSQTARLAAAVDGGVWSVTPFELKSEDGGDVVLELEARCEQAAFPVPHMLWVAPEVLVEPAAVGAALDTLVALPTPVRDAASVQDGPLISILTPVRDPDPRFLDGLLSQVRAQTFDHWELCVVDDGSTDAWVQNILEGAAYEDPRVRVRRRKEVGGISVATNDALAMATGDYVALLDHDDVLTATALQEVASAIAADSTVDMLYSDEDHITPADQRFLPYRKPDWAPDTLRSQMYTGHLGVFRRQLVMDIGGFRPRFDGSQDYDFVLRVTERTLRIRHLDQILYHWRVHPQSAASGAEAKPYAYAAARRALQEHVDRVGLAGSVEFGERFGTYRIVYDVDPDIAVDIILPVGGLPEQRVGSDELAQTLAAGGHGRWQVVLAGPEADARRWAAALGEAGLAPDRIRTAGSEAASGAAYVAAARTSQADHLLFLEDAVAARTNGWLRVLIGLSSQSGVGAVGAKVLARDGRVEHAGIVVGGGLPLAVYHGAGAQEIGHLNTLRTTVNRSAVDGVVMAPRAALIALGGLEESLGRMAIVDYCLRAGEKGLRIVWTPDALLWNTTAGHAPVNDLMALEAFRGRWLPRIQADPFYNRALWQERADFTVLG